MQCMPGLAEFVRILFAGRVAHGAAPGPNRQFGRVAWARDAVEALHTRSALI
jgi:hypothetical protein